MKLSQGLHLSGRGLTSSLLIPILWTTVAMDSSVAWASTGAHHEPSFSDITFHWINFVLYIGAMTYLLRKPIQNSWAARAKRIKQEVQQCTDEVDAAERELNAIEALTKGLSAEQERVRQEIATQAKLEAEEILKQANQRAVRIREQGKELLKGEARSAETLFRASLVQRAVHMAKERFTRGEYASREQAYVDAAVTRAKNLVQ